MITIFHVPRIEDNKAFVIVGENPEDAFFRAKETNCLPNNFPITAWHELAKPKEHHESLDEFEMRYEPMKNNFDESAAYEGAWFETFGEAELFVRNADPKTVWTIVEGDEFLWLIAGFHYVNRFGYLITRTPWKSDDEIYFFE
ncbi:MAG TPA: hypothetical protein VE344_10470 [Methylomirabilota bacterium]|nr:hypothetical protein [Methylomirabilota bacterium]